MRSGFSQSNSARNRLKAPEDGIVFSQRPRGWLADRWNAIYSRLPRDAAKRVSQGKSFARGGRIRDLWFSPGLVSAEVVDDDSYQISIKVNLFNDEQWNLVANVLSKNIAWLADLLEGKFPKSLLRDLIKGEINPLPTLQDLEGDCTCDDFHYPCVHVAAVHLLMADALDGDPFLLFTLRGRSRDQLLGEMRSIWGDNRAMKTAAPSAEADPPKGDWLTSPTPVEIMSFSFRPSTVVAKGLRALGPPPGDAQLSKALSPLYADGSEASQDMAMAEFVDDETVPKMTFNPVGAEEDFILPEEQEERLTKIDLAEQIVDLLCSLDAVSSKEIASQLGVNEETIDSELSELLEMGMVYQTSTDGDTLWWLG